jgi:UDP-3-O-[3-hydroxymyristoyl] glucosamine N-acyltransferase
MKSFTLEELAKLTRAELVGDPQHVLSNIDSLESATSSDVAFLANLRYRDLLNTTQAGVVCIDPSVTPLAYKNYLISEDPSRTFQQIAELFLSASFHITGFEGIHPSAIIHPSAQIGEGVEIGPHTVIDQGVIIGPGTHIAHLVSIGPGVTIGSSCVIHSHVSIRERCRLGDRVILQPGAVIGSCGFGYTTDAKGIHNKLDQIGIVVIEDDVEIGANTTIDRARFKETRIGKGSKIDNLVQIAHNVHIGPYNLIVSQVGIAGSSKTGRHVVLGGQVGVVGHVHIADGAMVSAQSGVSKDIPKSGKYGGSPAISLNDHHRQLVYIRKLESYIKKLEALEKRLNDIST